MLVLTTGHRVGLSLVALLFLGTRLSAQENLPASFTGLPVIPKRQLAELPQTAILAATSGDLVGVGPAVCLKPADEPREPFCPRSYQERVWHVHDTATEQMNRLCHDFENMYLSKNVIGLGLAVAVAAPLACTSADQEARDWYQREARGREADEWARRGSDVGDYWVTIPLLVGASVAGGLFPEYAPTATAGEWGNRSIRALLVGAPAVVAVQVGLDHARPEDRPGWEHLEDVDAVATQGFVGAVPFLTAASMVESRPLRYLLVAGSLWPTWAGLHDDSQTVSQAVLGWSIAVLATHSVNQTEAGASRLRLTPVALPHGPGVGVVIKY
jgi:hypothetical protein